MENQKKSKKVKTLNFQIKKAKPNIEAFNGSINYFPFNVENRAFNWGRKQKFLHNVASFHFFFRKEKSLHNRNDSNGRANSKTEVL